MLELGVLTGGILLCVIIALISYKFAQKVGDIKTQRFISVYDIEKAKLIQKNESLQTELYNVKKTISEIEKDRLELIARNAKLQENAKIDSIMKNQFQAIATDVIKEQIKFINLESKESLETVLSPMTEKIVEYQKDLSYLQEKNLEYYDQLKSQVDGLKSLGNDIKKEADSLTNALRKDSKIQGSWGEVILERCLERSGLTRGAEYESIRDNQQNNPSNDTQNNEGNPDFVVKLPEDRFIYIDAKSNLSAWVDYQNADTESLKIVALKALESSFYNNIRQLSSKDYFANKRIKNITDILMFIPIEAAFYNSVVDSQKLLDEAWKNDITIVTPTTLFPVLKLINYFWFVDRQNKNTEKVLFLATDAVNKLDIFSKNFSNMGNIVKDLSTMYQVSENNFYGSGGLIRPMLKIANITGANFKNIDTEDLILEDENHK